VARAKIIQAGFVIIVLAICMIANAVQTDVSGKWEMCANTNYEFDLDLGQSGDQISGTMTRTNGNEPVDSIYGTVSSDGKITFKRERPGQWVQNYTGQMEPSHIIWQVHILGLLPESFQKFNRHYPLATDYWLIWKKDQTQ
jgi:hypothetical protein